MKVVIIVEGGNVQEVYAEGQDVTICIIDKDNFADPDELREEFGSDVEDIDDVVEKETAGMNCVY